MTAWLWSPIAVIFRTASTKGFVSLRVNFWPRFAFTVSTSARWAAMASFIIFS